MKRSKNYQKAKDTYKSLEKYSIQEALEILEKFPKVKFDESVEVHIKLNIDPKKTDQQIRTALILPHGTGGKKKKIVVFTENQQDEAKKYGADVIGDEEMIKKIAKEKKVDFDVVVATPEMMPKLSKIAKILGPKGLMPNPKAGTVGVKVKEMIEELKKGKVEIKTDKGGNIHQVIGKRSFDLEKLKKNFKSLIDAIQKNKSTKVKGQIIKNISISATMTPSIQIKNI